MTERLRFVIAGFFVGLAELLPGISGSTVAIAFKVYEKFILFLSNLKISNFSFNFKKLNQVFFLDLIIPFFIAMAISVIFASKFILFLYSEYTNGFLTFLAILMCLISLLIAYRLKKEFEINLYWFIYFLAGAILGTSIAALVGIVFLFARKVLPEGNNVKKTLVLSGLMWFTIFVIPFLKYPANPPTVGETETVVLRSILFLSFIAISGLGAVGFYQVYKRLQNKKIF